MDSASSTEYSSDCDQSPSHTSSSFEKSHGVTNYFGRRYREDPSYCPPIPCPNLRKSRRRIASNDSATSYDNFTTGEQLSCGDAVYEMDNNCTTTNANDDDFINQPDVMITPNDDDFINQPDAMITRDDDVSQAEQTSNKGSWCKKVTFLTISIMMGAFAFFVSTQMQMDLHFPMQISMLRT